MKGFTSTTEENKRVISEYYDMLGFRARIPESLPQYLRVLFRHDANDVLVVDSKALRAPAKVSGMRRCASESAAVMARQRLALCESLLLLNRKGVPCFFCNRVGLKKDGFEYSESAKGRMSKGDSFPKLVEDPEKYAETFGELLGARYSLEYVRGLAELPQVIEKGGRYLHEDCNTKLINVVGGLRITPNQSSPHTKTLHVYGRCGAFGYAVEDSETLPAFLQLAFNEACRAEDAIRVINHGLWGGDDACVFHNFIVDSQGFSEGDMVLFYMKHLPEREVQMLERLGVTYFDITDRWHDYPEAKWCFYDKPGHMGADGYKNAASIIGAELLNRQFEAGAVGGFPKSLSEARHYSAYLKDGLGFDFEVALDGYLDSVKAKYPPPPSEDIVGAIVMNCNPFTFGHLHLIEHACQQVDSLYVFVVEEDKSFFRFDDRFQMVCDGVAHLQNVRVCPSGSFMISALTFPEYFMKDFVKEKNFDVSSDLDIFCTRIAPEFNISVRFAGEEPTDPVTAHYNEEMSKILPEHGLSFCEIPRLVASDGAPLSATKVRELIRLGDVEGLKDYVPETTLEILREKYMSA